MMAGRNAFNDNPSKTRAGLNIGVSWSILWDERKRGGKKGDRGQHHWGGRVGGLNKAREKAL